MTHSNRILFPQLAFFNVKHAWERQLERYRASLASRQRCHGRNIFLFFINLLFVERIFNSWQKSSKMTKARTGRERGDKRGSTTEASICTSVGSPTVNRTNRKRATACGTEYRTEQNRTEQTRAIFFLLKSRKYAPWHDTRQDFLVV